MEITTKPAGDYLEVWATGRLDGSWATHFSTTLDELVRQGHHQIRVNLSGVTYISSMGVGVLVECYKNLIAIQGVLVVRDPSPTVAKILDMVDLRHTLMAEPLVAVRPIVAAIAAPVLDRGEALFEVHELEGTGVRCRLLGDPSPLQGCRFDEAHCRPVLFGADAFGIGLGAFGSSFQDCQARFGEFLGVAGAAAYQPADGSNTADYMIGSSTSPPEVQVLYALAAQGSFPRMARFEVKPGEPAVGLTALAEVALELVQGPAAWIALVAETAGLAGVSLRRSPVNGDSDSAPYGHPEIRDWLSFSSERTHARSLAVATGMVRRSSASGWDALTRPLSRGSALAGHVHAAAFSYRPLPKGRIDMEETIRGVFANEMLQGVLHLIGDDRDAERVDESEFVRGALWMAPLTAAEGTGSAS